MPDMRIVIPALIALSFAVVPAAVAGEEGARTLTAGDLWRVERPGTPEVSPDGRWFVLPLTRYDIDENEGTTDLVLGDLRDGALRQITHHDSADTSPAWHPGSRRIAFVSRRDGDSNQLFVMPIDGGEPERLTDLPVPVSSPQWFPDGERIAFWAKVPPHFEGDWSALADELGQRKEDQASARVTENRIYRFWDGWLTDGDVHRLFAYDTGSGEITDLMPGQDRMLVTRGAPSYSISPGGDEIAVSANTNPEPYDSVNLDILLLTPDGSGSIRNITAHNPANDSAPVYSADGRYIFYGEQRRVDFYADTRRIVRYDRRDGSRRVLTGDTDLSFSNWRPDEDGRTVYAQAQDRGATSLFSIRVSDGRVREVHRGGTVSGMRLGPRDTLLFIRHAFSEPPELHTVGRNGRNPSRLTHFNDAVMEGIEFGRAESVVYRGANGAEVQMWVVYPPGFDPDEVWPLLTLIHGGPHGIFGDGFHFCWNAQLFAAPGYVTILPNFHGSTSFGQEFAESIHGNHAELPYTDVMKAVDHMLETGFIDASRMAAAGGSYGGYLVSWIAGHTDRFAALINHAGVYNIMGQFASDVTRHREAAYGAPPWEDLERMNRYNPAMHAEHFVTPMLILHGERDYRVPVTQGLEVYGVYKGKGVPARLVYYPDENHWILKPQNSIHWFGEFHGWLERWLGAGPG